MREKLVLPPRVTAAQRRGLPLFLVGSSSSSRHLSLWLIITGTSSSCRSPRLPSSYSLPPRSISPVRRILQWRTRSLPSSRKPSPASRRSGDLLPYALTLSRSVMVMADEILILSSLPLLPLRLFLMRFTATAWFLGLQRE